MSNLPGTGCFLCVTGIVLEVIVAVDSQTDDTQTGGAKEKENNWQRRVVLN